jgi:hypothetical protein
MNVAHEDEGRLMSRNDADQMRSGSRSQQKYEKILIPAFGLAIGAGNLPS